MGLAHIQQGLAQLVTNAQVCERFFADPHAVGQTLGLSPEEVSQLAQLSPQQVNCFASSLQRKRLNEVCKLAPHTPCVR